MIRKSVIRLRRAVLGWRRVDSSRAAERPEPNGDVLELPGPMITSRLHHHDCDVVPCEYGLLRSRRSRRPESEGTDIDPDG